MADVQYPYKERPDLDDISDVVQIANEGRRIMLARNNYNTSNIYDSTNRDVISDGDNKGRELGRDETIGTSIDITRRHVLQMSNKYRPSKIYTVREG